MNLPPEVYQHFCASSDVTEPRMRVSVCNLGGSVKPVTRLLVKQQYNGARLQRYSRLCRRQPAHGTVGAQNPQLPTGIACAADDERSVVFAYLDFGLPA